MRLPSGLNAIGMDELRVIGGRPDAVHRSEHPRAARSYLALPVSRVWLSGLKATATDRSGYLERMMLASSWTHPRSWLDGRLNPPVASQRPSGLRAADW